MAVEITGCGEIRDALPGDVGQFAVAQLFDLDGLARAQRKDRRMPEVEQLAGLTITQAKRLIADDLCVRGPDFPAKRSTLRCP